MSSDNKRPYESQLQNNENKKRRQSEQSNSNNMELKREEAKRKARERLAQLKAKKSGTPPPPLSSSSTVKTQLKARGLNIELHPLLSGKPAPAPKINPNLQKLNKQGFQVNPYLDNLAPTRAKRELQFNEHGKYIKQAQDLRETYQQEQLQRKILQQRKEQGLEPDLILKEDKFKSEQPPPVMEWWDEPYYNNKDYDSPNSEVSIYVHHPIPINAPWEKHLPPMKPMFLTKKEMKRLRRNDRFIKNKEIQEKIKLGLLPPVKTKVKLANLMNVLTSEAIKDPTAIEAKVRSDIEQRRIIHLETNEERKLTKEQKSEKRELKYSKDILEKGYFMCCFLIQNLSHPSHKFKIETNAKQLRLTGTVIHIDGSFSLVITQGTEKSIKFYKKLLTSRIKWQESTTINDPGNNGNQKKLDLSDNYCHLLWEGQIPEMKFDRFSFFKAKDEETAAAFLDKFDMSSVFREAVVYYRDKN